MCVKLSYNLPELKRSCPVDNSNTMVLMNSNGSIKKVSDTHEENAQIASVAASNIRLVKNKQQLRSVNFEFD